MGLSYSDVQSAIDNDGYVYFDKGTHTITQKVVIDGTREVLIKGHPQSTVVWTGNAADAPFVFDAANSTPAKCMFQRVTATSSVDGSPIFKIQDNTDRPNFLTMMDCDFTVSKAYAVDLKRTPYIITPRFFRMKTTGGGAIRWRARTGGSDPYHSVSQCLFDGWHHTGSGGRVGPAWDFLGMSGFRMRNFHDTGSPALIQELIDASWEGPVCFRMNSCRTKAEARNMLVDYDEDFTNAAGCWLYEIRTDSGTGTGKQEHFEAINWTMRDDNLDVGVEPWVVMGADGIGHALTVDVVDCHNVEADDFLIGGRAWVRAIRPYYDPGNESLLTALETKLNAIASNSVLEPIICETDRAPSNTDNGGLLYSGSSLETNYQSTAVDYEDVI